MIHRLLGAFEIGDVNYSICFSKIWIYIFYTKNPLHNTRPDKWLSVTFVENAATERISREISPINMHDISAEIAYVSTYQHTLFLGFSYSHIKKLLFAGH